MSEVKTKPEPTQNTQISQFERNLRLCESNEPAVLAEIYDKNTDIAIWKRELPHSLQDTVADFIDFNPNYKMSVAIAPTEAQTTLNELLGNVTSSEFCDDVATLIDMFCTLFGIEQAGVRLSVLDNAMCPRFHVDRIPCRLLTTYQGIATQWLHDEHVDRSKLGHGSCGKPDCESGLFVQSQGIQQLNQGDVAILKGDLWHGNEGRGLVHRSPSTGNARRLLLTIDIVS